MLYMQHKPSTGTPCIAPFQEFMYEGRIDVINTVCEIPDNKPAWRERLLGLGFADISYDEFCKCRGIDQAPKVMKATRIAKPPQPVSILNITTTNAR